MFESKNRLAVLSLAAILSLSVFLVPSINENRVFAHGDTPGECEDVYDATIISMTIDNGVDTFDPIANPNLHFDANVDTGYTVTFTLHTAGHQQEDFSNLPGSTWYRTTAVGFANGVCVDDVEADSFKTITTHISENAGVPDDYNYPRVEWGTISDGDQIIYSMTWQHEPLTTAGSESELTVRTKDGHTDNEISGYWTVLSRDGSTVATEFSPAAFALDNGENYVVSVADYGQYVFDHWQDTDSTVRDRAISVSSDTAITAVYRNVNSPPLTDSSSGDDQQQDDSTTDNGDTSTSASASISVSTIDKNSGSKITGYYTILSDNNGNVLETGFSPVTFDDLTAGNSYIVEVQDYGSYYFNHWLGDGSMDRSKQVTAESGQLALTAAYDNTPEQEQPSSEQQQDSSDTGEDSNNDDSTDDSSSAPGSIAKVQTETVDFTPIHGFYASLWLDGAQIDSCFTSCSFELDAGVTYQVALADYGDCTFAHWGSPSDPITTERFLTVHGPEGPTSLPLHGYYNCS